MIFEDVTHRRWKLTVVMALVLGVVGVVLTVLFTASVVLNPPLPGLERIAAAERTARVIRKKAQADQASTSFGRRQAASKRHPLPPSEVTGSGGAFLRLPRKGPQFVTAFLLQNDPDSMTSLKEHSDTIDAVFPDWYFLTTATCAVDERIDADAQAAIRRAHLLTFPRVTNGEALTWHTPEVNALLRNENDRTCVAHLLATFADAAAVEGLNMDIETIDPKNRDNYLELLISLAKELHVQGKLLTVDVTANDPAYDIEAIGQVADAVVLMNYDEHYLTSAPGPITSQEWFQANLDDIVLRVPRDKVIVAIGNYADDWSQHRPTNSMTFSEVMALADETGAEPAMDDTSWNMYFAYSDPQGVAHDVWFLNSVTAWNQVRSVGRSHSLGVSLWRLGSEDPTLWRFIGGTDESPMLLRQPATLRSILSVSDGEVFRIRAFPHAGSMDIHVGSDGSVDAAQYLSLPSGYLLERVGGAIPPKTLVLTFDDGPDPLWTAEILSVLREARVPAVFFVVGDQAERYPAVVRAEVTQGSLLGNHTYLHPDISTILSERLRLELNAAQRVIENASGHRTLLFRSPFNTDTNPSEPSQLDPLREAGDAGYIIVGANIDASDWKRPGVATIVDDVLRQTQEGDNHIIVMHDAGGDRSETVAALKLLIPALRSRGFRFASLDEATGIPASVLMPPLRGAEAFLVASSALMHACLGWALVVITWLFFFTTALAVVRIAFLGFLVLRSLRSSVVDVRWKEPPVRVNVLIPAFNEGKTLERTIRSLQASNYAGWEVLVIDDGSTDDSANVVRALMAHDPRIRLLSQPNGGKSSALNHGLREATASIVITIDADTIVLKDTLAALVAPFADPTVDAVCGNVEVGNVRNILTGFQALEYITTQNFDRRAFEELNCISVVPGATGAWRRDKLLALGGYRQDTLTEDADLTLTLLRHGGKIVYAPEARSMTEAPATLATLARQRFRWSFGTFQCLWKHRSAFFSGSLGWVALPNMFFFQILFPILSPIGDAVFLLSILRGDLQAIAVGYALFLSMDLGGSLLAFTLERRPKKLMWLILIQRFFYRQFMYVITFRSILAILRGRRHGWGKLERKGTVPDAGHWTAHATT